MTDSVQSIVWHSLFYGLGAAGLFAIGALPLRTFMFIRDFRANSESSWQITAVLVAAIVAAILASQFLHQLGKCLLGFHCSANAAGGWINAAFIGAIYTIFEFVAFTIHWVGGRRGVAT